jgi:hypothetical protein
MNGKTRRSISVLVVLLLAFVAVATVAAQGRGPVDNFRAHLSGANEVPAVDTLSQGQAIFQVSNDGSSLSYRLIVANLNDTLQAHIHVGPPGENGPVVAFLYPSAPPAQLIEGRFSGVLATGEVTADDLRGPLTGMSLDDLLAEIAAGNTYVNVHTVANPGGEIRGQIR